MNRVERKVKKRKGKKGKKNQRQSRAIVAAEEDEFVPKASLTPGQFELEAGDVKLLKTLNVSKIPEAIEDLAAVIAELEEKRTKYTEDSQKIVDETTANLEAKRAEDLAKDYRDTVKVLDVLFPRRGRGRGGRNNRGGRGKRFKKQDYSDEEDDQEVDEKAKAPEPKIVSLF